MAQLSKILGMILRDMVAAQHEANMYALKLATAYRNQSQAATLGPPAVCLGEMELMLHCGFTGNAVLGEDYEIDQTAVLRTIKELSDKLSEMIVSSILSTIVQNKESDELEEGPITQLNREKTLRRNFVTYLSRKLLTYLKEHRAEFIALDGTIDTKTLIESVLLISDREFISHSDLGDAFEKDSSGELRNKIKENLRSSVDLLLPRLLADINISRPSQYSSMDVIVSSEELSKLPDECIQTLRLKISPRDLPSETNVE